jgi:hypothetical protein
MAKRPFKKCIVRGCNNQKNQGNFVGDLCVPCFEFIAEGVGIYSQAYRNAIKTCSHEITRLEKQILKFKAFKNKLILFINNEK